MEIRVTPTRKLFENEDDNFYILACDVHEEDEEKVELNSYEGISIKGTAPKISLGEEYIAKLAYDDQGTRKGSYIIESIRQEKPTTIEGQRKFFQMILTNHQLDAVYAVYEGQDIIELIKNDTFDYSNVKGLGEKTYEKMREKVLNNLEMSELLIFLATHGLRFNMVNPLIRHYKNPQLVMEKIQGNPYILTEVKGIGFHKADAIAKAMKFDMHSVERIYACVYYILGEETANGHSWMPRRQLLDRAIDYLTINRPLIEKALDNGIPDVLNLDGRFTRLNIYETECYIAEQLIRLKSLKRKVFKTEEIDAFLKEYCEEHQVELEENQYQFFHDWNENSLLLLIGGGGMGKSWLQRILLELVRKKNLRTALLAPTGRASKVMSNYAMHPASTIHRKTGAYGEDGSGNDDAIVEEDIVIVDESSMCDIHILARLFRALSNPNVRVLFVGDDFQLPSVGVGNFLYDVINSGNVKVCKLKKVFRQADGGILNVSTDVKEGRNFLNPKADGRIVFGKDCVFWLTDQQFVKDGVLFNYKNALKKFAQEDITILSPTNKGKLGTHALNKEIQKIANPFSPHKKQKEVGKRSDPTIFRVGDLVMNLVNSYKMETTEEDKEADVFNGDIGKIVDISDEEKVFIIDFDGLHVKMKFSVIMSNLQHAWVSTIHKAQGSQTKVVIVIADKSTKFQLNANLLYTGFSRATDYMLVLGQAETIIQSMKKFANMERRSFLQELIHRYDEKAETIEQIDKCK